MWLNVVLFCFNAIFLALGFYLIKSNLEKKVMNKDILSKIKKEINSIIVELNNTTLNSVSLVEQKLKDLDDKIIIADKKRAGLKIDFSKSKEDAKDLFTNIQNNQYSPDKIVKKSQLVTEKVIEVENKRNSEIDNEIKDMNDAEKARYLIKKGWKVKDIQKKTGLSSGEMELLLNTENISV